jgi:aminopeptidase N
MVGGEELSEDETYAGNDIYTKGAFFMHSLRFVLGDQVFFPTIKKLSTDPQYTYDNFVTSKDVEELFSNAAGYSIKPFFDFYLRTTKTIEINVKELGYNKYLIKPNNYIMDLPLEIVINGKTEKITLTKDGVTVNSSHPPMIDPTGYYLKTVTIQ